MARKASTARPLDPAERDRLIIAGLDLRSEFAALGVKFASNIPNGKGFIACYAVFREERSPSAGANVFTGRYSDRGGQGENLSFWEFAARAGKFVDWRAAREHYAAKVGVGPMGKGGSTKTAPRVTKSLDFPQNRAKNEVDEPQSRESSRATKSPARNPLDQLEFMEWAPGYERLTTIWCVRHKPGVTLESIRAAGGRIARYKTKTAVYTVIALPVWGPDLLSAEPISWIGYNITGGMLPAFRKLNGKWEIDWLKKPKSFAPIGGGLIGRHGLARLQAAAIDTALANTAAIDAVWKVEGPSDLLTLWATIPPEMRDRHPIVTNAGGAAENVQPHVAALFAGLSVNVVHDADQAGEIGAAKWLAALAGIAAEVKHVQLPYPVEAKHGKDLRDWLRADNASPAKEDAAA